jgi:prepilin-type N-terminal cleavage/methylation domain-containing protein
MGSPAMTESMKDAGYTLVELLVVLLLCSFIALAVGGGLHFGTRVWEASETGVQSAARVDSAQTLLRELIAAATPVTRDGEVVFDGDPSHVAFEAPAPRALKSAGLVKVDIAADSRDSAAVLRIALGSKADDHEISIPTGAAALRFAYLDAQGTVPIWLDRWHDRNRLPDAVRIEGDDAASKVAWPEFIVKLAISERPNCQFDPIALDCRGSSP